MPTPMRSTVRPSASRHQTPRGGAVVAGLLCATFLLAGFPSPAAAVCPKSQILETLFTKVCWGCIFPFRLGGITLLNRGLIPDPMSPSSPFCNCPDSLLPGVTTQFTEPVRLIEVVREPYCFPSLEGTELKKDSLERAGVYSESLNGDTTHAAFYQVHYIGFPIWELIGLTVSFVGQSISDVTVGFFPDLSKCFLTGGYDVSNYALLYLSELDPTWNDDELGALLSPEAALFATPVTQAVCAADCLAASTGLPLDPLFWCAGCWGSMYPFGGTVAGPVGEANTAALLATRALAKLNRGYFEALTSTSAALCGKIYTGMIRKSQYRLQLISPSPNTQAPGCCTPIGRSALLWASGKAYPVQGEDFSFLVWRQRDCCAR